MFIAIVGSAYLCGRFLDRRKFSDFGFQKKNFVVDYLLGFLYSILLVGLMFAVELGTGNARLVRSNFAWLVDRTFVTGLLDGSLTCILVGFHEEILRNYQIKNISEGFAKISFLRARGAVIAAILISSVIFGCMHLGNSNVTPLAVFLLFVDGIILSLMYVLTGSAAWSFGFHAGWDLAEGNIFGFPVSGLNEECSLLSIQHSGNDLITGGAFGPDGGMINLIMVVAGTIGTLAYARYRRGGKLQFDSRLTQWEDPLTTGVEAGEPPALP